MNGRKLWSIALAIWAALYIAAGIGLTIPLSDPLQILALIAMVILIAFNR